jgi:hypothetical protein
MTRSKIQSSGSDAMPYSSKTLVATMIQSASAFPSAWTKLHLRGSSHSRSARSTCGTSSRNISLATSRALWVARVLAWTWQWLSRNRARPYASTCGASSKSAPQ